PVGSGNSSPAPRLWPFPVGCSAGSYRGGLRRIAGWIIAKQGQRNEHVRRRRRGDLQRRAAGIKRQRDRSGVELERLPTLRIPISEIADDRAAKCRAMDAELMRTAGARPQLEPGAAAVRTEEPIIGHCSLPRW